MDQIEIYKSSDDKIELRVNLDKETVWLTQKQMAMLFDCSTDNISLHLKNIFKTKELDDNSVTEEFSVTASDGKKYKTKHYNLDAIISIGYRINSQRATQFRQWATQRLKDYLVKGYAVNQKRLEQLQQTIQLITKGGGVENLQLQEAKGLLDIITNYTQSFVLLNRFDSNSLPLEHLNTHITYEIRHDEAVSAIIELKRQLIKKKEASSLFGNQKDQSLEGILKSVIQTFDGQYLYPSIEEQAAHLLYFVIKNHPFTDGNKRIGAFLFVWFLDKNRHRFKKSGEVKINDNALVALALLVAQSNPADKELMIRLIINLVRS
ncbi:MAG: type II toxin-antitoxin system death-on-curing family toxin [Nitrospiraceae bacterium]|nr:MAG: type II toxin-antitoxin system death-on-curing family toxin [Nitrospiraceae bacterium]